MLIRFVVSNFLSFKDETVFNMIADTSLKTHKNHVYPVHKKVSVLRGAAIYGANAAGKSNLIKAIEALTTMIERGKVAPGIDHQKFRLDTEYTSKPISFEIELEIEGKIYRYGLDVHQGRVVEEWLLESGITKADKLIFERKMDSEGKVKIQFAKEFVKTQKERYLVELMESQVILKYDELIISMEKFGNELSISILTSFKQKASDCILVIFPYTKFQELLRYIQHQTVQEAEAFDNLISSLDLGIDRVILKNTPYSQYYYEDISNLKENIITELDAGKPVYIPESEGGVMLSRVGSEYSVMSPIFSSKGKFDKEVHFVHGELSDGTKRLLDFIPLIDLLLSANITIFIDEIDQSIHPVLLKIFIEKLMSNDNLKGQLIFTTHESNLLDMDIFRQDEVWFAEKNRESGASQFYSLVEFKPRYDLDIRKGYLNGRFGAIPFTGDLERLKWGDSNSSDLIK